jgi:hypothetical protein
MGNVYHELEGAARITDGDRIGGVLDPRPPAAIVDGDCGPAHQIGVEECLTGAPSGATVKRNAFVRGDTPGMPLGGDIMIVAHGVVNVTMPQGYGRSDRLWRPPTPPQRRRTPDQDRLPETGRALAGLPRLDARVFHNGRDAP